MCHSYEMEDFVSRQQSFEEENSPNQNYIKSGVWRRHVDVGLKLICAQGLECHTSCALRNSFSNSVNFDARLLRAAGFTLVRWFCVDMFHIFSLQSGGGSLISPNMIFHTGKEGSPSRNRIVWTPSLAAKQAIMSVWVWWWRCNSRARQTANISCRINEAKHNPHYPLLLFSIPGLVPDLSLVLSPQQWHR